MDQAIKIQAEPQDARRCRFVVDRPVYEGGSVYFGAPERAAGSSLVEKLFALPGVESVLVQDHLVVVDAETGGNWLPLAKQIGSAIREVLQSGEKPISDSVLSAIPHPAEIKKRVQEVFDEQINPAIAMHGGWVELIDVKRNEVFIRMGGGCQGCGMADVTLKQGIEQSIRAAVPEVGAILDTTDHAAGRNPYYQPSK